MEGHDFKRAGIIRAGFQYQDLVAIEILIEFYTQSDRYDWVKLEAEEGEFRSIDDVVACRKDGLFELTQVKFTVDPNIHSLNWEWLTARKGSQKSLLQKWAQTTQFHLSQETLASATLKTDRIPDEFFQKCLDGNKVNYSRLPADVKSKIDEQLETPEHAIAFFDNFEFLHSLPKLDEFEAQLRSKVVSDTGIDSWYSFQYYVRLWAVRKNQPPPNGEIKYIHLHQALCPDQPRPISQDFLVPPSYQVPDRSFDTEFIDEITATGGTTVIWGPPGRGKSTYLSHCFAQFNRQRIACIRHHYFLSLDDRSVGRFNFHLITRSLEYQLTGVLPHLEVKSNNLSKNLENAATSLRDQGRLLIVIVDGLDHVWREKRNREHMDELFDALLPLPTNVRLIVGTQKISSEHLPAKLLATHPEELWVELPLMSYSSVNAWLMSKDDSGILNLSATKWTKRNDAISEVAAELHKISNGLPLHLIYSFESLVKSGKSIDADSVRELPACPDGDIRTYYRLVWNRVSPKAQSILHTLAGLHFGPPPFAMQACFGSNNESLDAVNEIFHLLDYQGMEVKPFHGSLYAFVRDVESHKSRFLESAADVLSWLESDAPEFWHWAWLWITRKQLGDPNDLLQKPDREWAVHSLSAGYSISQIVKILEHAELAAFEAFNLPRLLTLRSLKNRVLHGPEWQTYEWPLYIEVALALSEDPYVTASIWSNPRQIDSNLFPLITRLTNEYDHDSKLKEAIDELNRRIEIGKYGNEFSNTLIFEDASNIVAVIANANTNQTQKVIDYARKFDDSYSLINKYVSACMIVKKYDRVFEVGKQFKGQLLDRRVFTALCLEGLSPASKPDLMSLTHPAILCLTNLHEKKSVDLEPQIEMSQLFEELDYHDSNFFNTVRDSLYSAFYIALSNGISGNKFDLGSTIPNDANSTWLAKVIRTLDRLAKYIADEWRDRQRWPSLKDFYDNFDFLPECFTQIQISLFYSVRLAILDIAVDMCLIGVNLDSNRQIEMVDIESVAESPYWLDELWLDEFIERRLVLHTRDAAQMIVNRIGNRLDKTVTEFSERSNTSIKLAQFAFDHGLTTSARKEQERAIRCLIGYGSHKDLYAREVLESLQALIENGDEEAKKTLLELAGEFELITEYTDGDETNHIRDLFYMYIGKYFPNRVAQCYAQLTKMEKWNYAETLSSTIAESDKIQTKTGKALLRSYITPPDIHALSDCSSQLASEALEDVLLKTGNFKESPNSDDIATTQDSRTDYSRTDADKVEESPLNPNEFPPNQLREILSRTNKYFNIEREKQQILEWLNFWVEAGHANDVLTELDCIYSDRNERFSLNQVLDEVFKISLDVQGRSKAFSWLVRSHISNYGWESWFSSKEAAQARFQAVALNYRKQWKEFVRETARPPIWVKSRRNEIDVGISRLIFFLLEVGEADLARECALELAREFREELKEQPIETPEWAK